MSLPRGHTTWHREDKKTTNGPKQRCKGKNLERRAIQRSKLQRENTASLRYTPQSPHQHRLHHHLLNAGEPYASGIGLVHTQFQLKVLTYLPSRSMYQKPAAPTAKAKNAKSTPNTKSPNTKPARYRLLPPSAPTPSSPNQRH